jgi:hypothetical protein
VFISVKSQLISVKSLKLADIVVKFPRAVLADAVT